MPPRRELLSFAAVLSALVGAFFHESLFGGKVLSPADVLFVSASFRERGGPLYEPANRLLMDPVLQFQPWLEFNRTMLRRGRLPLWNSHAGCGAPHLANGQSAVFDPFNALGYLAPLPDAYAWMAAGRLFAAGLGMFVLARSWGLAPWGRWFAGLTFPFCGFLVAWLLYPVTNVAAWMPWLFWATDRALARPGARSAGIVAVTVALVLLGGHVQTSAHVLLAAGVYAAWRLWRTGVSRAGALSCVAGGLLGLAVAAIEIVPLGFYLARSPVWNDRAQERVPFWVVTKPRWLDALGTGLPYAFGSQRRGHPNLARAVGAHNLNETAGGFAGLATLLWLAPAGWAARGRLPRAEFLGGLVALGALGAFGLPPVDNLLRALPVLDVTDNRRLTLWIAFGLVLLGACGMDALAETIGSRRRIGPAIWMGGAVVLAAIALNVPHAETRLRSRALEHYARASAATPGADPAVYAARAERQVHQVLGFVPAYLGLASAHLAALAALATLAGRGAISARPARASLLAITLVDLFAFGLGLNPAIAREDDRPASVVINDLLREVGRSGRVIGLGEELPPNVLMRYGLADARNYDSVELSRSLAWFAPLYEPSKRPVTSRGEITWAGVQRARERLEEAAVSAVVSADAPPERAFRNVERVGAAWVVRLDAQPLVSADAADATLTVERDEGLFHILVENAGDVCIQIRETFDPGWRAILDGVPAAVEPYRDTFLAVRVAPGRHRLTLRYDPREVRGALATSFGAALLTVFALTGFRPFRSIRIIGRGLGRP
ncbi:MAG: hypothetical protein P4L84_01175 [Isosphaeraceae bacterium]|nr:hypothetical protein [Isosphaeraceae bacterium]